MTYADKLSPWCLVRLQSNMQNEVVARFRRRNDAEAHLQIFQPGIRIARTNPCS
jgi:hypothetical protein